MNQQFMYLLNTVSCNIIICNLQIKSETSNHCELLMMMSLKKQQSVVTHWHTVLGGHKKLDQSTADQHFRMLYFYENIRTSNIVIEDVFQPNCQVMKESHYDWLIVWVTTYCHFVTNLLLWIRHGILYTISCTGKGTVVQHRHYCCN